MNKYIITILIFHICINSFYSQPISQNDIADKYFENTSEVYFKFYISNKDQINLITKIISIENFKDGYIYAYANKKQFKKFLLLNIDYEILTPLSSLYNSKMSKSLNDLYSWNSYPTYPQYDSIMHKFETDYPNICKLVEIGTSVKGRKIYFLKISDSINISQNKPEFMYSSSIHGNEPVGYVLMLRLINYILTNYGTNVKINNLVDNIDIWINPLANPDGTYAGGDSTINGSTRGNFYGIDINRNYPDPQDGEHPDGEVWQTENISMMNFMSQHNFILSANFHTGAELLNYPWDTWNHTHADDAWFKYICHQYADTAQSFSSSLPYYFQFYDDGISNGFDWYEVNGGRQDYVNYFLHGREVTIEISNQNKPNSNTLDLLWNANYRSFLNYIQQTLYGIQGTITDSLTGEPIRAKIEVLSHDLDNSFIFSDSIYGKYHRLINQGTYNLKYSASGYKNKFVSNVHASNMQTTILDVQMVKGESGIENKDNNVTFLNIYPNPFENISNIEFEIKNNSEVSLFIYNALGEKKYYTDFGFYNKGKYDKQLNLNEIKSGMYYCYFIAGNQLIIKKIVILR